MKLILVISFFFLLCANYKLTYLFEYHSSEEWWDNRFKIYSLMFLIAAYYFMIDSKSWKRLICNVLFGFCFSDFIERTIYNTSSFNYTDLLIIFVVIFIDFSKYLKQRLNEKRH